MQLNQIRLSISSKPDVCQPPNTLKQKIGNLLWLIIGIVGVETIDAFASSDKQTHEFGILRVTVAANGTIVGSGAMRHV